MITTDQMRRELALPAERESEYSDLKDGVIALWEAETRLLWNARTDHVQEVRVRPQGRTMLLLELVNVSSVTSVEGKYDTDDDWTDVDEEDYEVEGDRRLVNKDGGWTYDRVRVTYTGGYSAAPADVQRALLVQLKFENQRLGVEKVGLKGQSFQGGTGTFETGTLAPFFEAAAKRRGRKA